MVKIGHYEVRTELFYWNSYVWIDRITDTELNIGLTDYAQQTLKDITHLDVPAVGQRFDKKGVLLTVESISKDYVVKSPISCVITAINMRIVNNPDLINTAPFDSWVLKVDALDLGELDLLIDGEDMADEILDEVGLEHSDVDSEVDDMGDDEFDYESEFSIDSADDYYDSDDDYYDNDDW